MTPSADMKKNTFDELHFIKKNLITPGSVVFFRGMELAHSLEYYTFLNDL